MANLFYTHKTVLGTSPSMGCEARPGRRNWWELGTPGVPALDTPTGVQRPHKGHARPCSPSARHEGKLLLKYKLCLRRVTFFHSSSGQEQPGSSGNPW